MPRTRTTKQHTNGASGTAGEGIGCTFAELVYAHHDWHTSPNGGAAAGRAAPRRSTGRRCTGSRRTTAGS